MDPSPRLVSSSRLERWLDLAVHLAVMGLVIPTALCILAFLSFLVFPLVPFFGLALIPMFGAGVAKTPGAVAGVERTAPRGGTKLFTRRLMPKRA
jgi:hypothetical protein